MMNRHKWKRISAISLGMLLAFTGCIKNDIPFEVIYGNITEMDIRGAASLQLNATDRVIDLVLDDTVDLRHVFLRDIRITPDARIVDNITHEAMDTLDSYYLDLTQGSNVYAISSNPYTFTVTTYQDYVWTLKASQNIERTVVLAPANQQIGKAVFSATTNSVKVYVPMDVSLDDIQIQTLKLGPSNSTLAWVSPTGIVENVNYKDIRDFRTPQKFIVKFFDITQDWIVEVEQSTKYVTSLQVDAWAKFANLSAEGLTSAGTCGFDIRKVGETAWIAVANVKVDGLSFSGKATGLTPETQYEVRGMIGEHEGDITTFTTESTPEIPNLDFNTWTWAAPNWYPNADAANSYWGSGNEGVTMSIVNKPANTVPTDDAVSVKAAKMTSIKVPIANFAAGNIFTGKYKTNISNPVSSVTFGRPYVGRPIRLKGWYKYTPQIVNVAGGAYTKVHHPEAVGKMDWCHIYLRLENWGGAVDRPANPKVIAYGEFKTDQTVAAYTPFEFEIVYSDTQTKPTHVTLVGTSSIYGEDFYGGEGSVLCIDQFELIFE